jgi:hypothetical protein
MHEATCNLRARKDGIIGVNSMNSPSSPTTAENDIEEYSHSVRDREFFLYDILVSHTWAPPTTGYSHLSFNLDYHGATRLV